MKGSVKRSIPAPGPTGSARKQRKLHAANTPKMGTVVQAKKSLTHRESLLDKPARRTLVKKKYAPVNSQRPARSESDDEMICDGGKENAQPNSCRIRVDTRVPSLLDDADHPQPSGTDSNPTRDTAVRSEALALVINAAEMRIKRHLDAVLSKFLPRIELTESMLKAIHKTSDEVKSGLSDVRLLTLKGSASACRGNTKLPVRKKAKTLMEEVEEKNPSVSHEMEVAFGPLVFCRACAYCVVSFLEACHERQDDVRVTGRTLSVLMYGLSSSCSKSEFKVGVRKKHADFRFKVACTCVDHARGLSEEAFKYHEKLVVADLVGRKGRRLESGNDLVNAVSKPSWLSPGFLSKEIMVMSRKYHECVKSEVPSIPTHPDRKLGLHVGRTVVSTVNDMLRRSRYSSRRKMFDAGFFLLVEWNDFKCFKSDVHSEPIIRFMWPDESAIDPIQVQECYSESDASHSEKNARLFGQLISERKEMIIECEYPVSVTCRSGGNKGRADSFTVRRVLIRNLNIMKIALSFMQSYCHFPQDVILNVHPMMLRTVYRVALLFREFFIRKSEEAARPLSAFDVDCIFSDSITGDDANEEERNEEGREPSDTAPLNNTSTGSDKGDHSNAKPVKSGGISVISLQNLIPSASEMESHMLRVLTMKEETYNNMKVRDTVHDNSEQNIETTGEIANYENEYESDNEDFSELLDED